MKKKVFDEGRKVGWLYAVFRQGIIGRPGVRAGGWGT